MALSLEQTQQIIQEYFEALLNHGDFAQYYSDEVTCSEEGTDQRCRGRDIVRGWIGHGVGRFMMRGLFAGAGHAVAEADFIRTDGSVVPFAVVYDLADGKITALRLYFTGPH